MFRTLSSGTVEVVHAGRHWFTVARWRSRELGAIRTGPVHHAFATVPRHLFITGFYTGGDAYTRLGDDLLDQIYSDVALMTHWPATRPDALLGLDAARGGSHAGGPRPAAGPARFGDRRRDRLQRGAAEIKAHLNASGGARRTREPPRTFHVVA
ncbi:hypothetical protein [Nonomuraea turkmeniaca]|uniref:hypothetical protein n=1 Tax=Nonomuraea turkmeniaca TaxID=103838 RepID=UPI0026B80C01